jgi:catechol 2,3-dioxygenase-like lactoylglutathione lyase family enzyme
MKKTILAVSLVVALFTTQVRAADAPALLGDSPGTFFAISVADLDKVLPWYRDMLGFRVYSEGVAPNRPIRFALLQQGAALIELLQLPDAKPRAEAAPGTTAAHQIHGFFKGGFVVKDIDAVYARLKRLGVKFDYELGKPPNGPYRSFGVRDPEGNLLQFFGP